MIDRGKRWTRRQRRMMYTVGVGTLLTLVAAGIVFFGPAPQPYTPGERMEGLTDRLTRSVPSNYPRIRFVDVSQEAGINFWHFQGTRSIQLPEDMGSGAAWGDYNRDGWLDLYVVNEAGPLTLSKEEIAVSSAHNVLYKNRGDGTFEEVTAQAGVGYRGCGQAVAWGDYDGDGWLDLFVTNYGKNVLYHNRGDETFEDVSERAGIADRRGFWGGVSWGDYDRDGDLDLYVCGYVQYRYDPVDAQKEMGQYNTTSPASLNPSAYQPERNLLYRNNGDGTFSETAESAGVAGEAGRSLSASWCDFDGDGWIDLYVANDVSDNVLYHNQGNGTFEEIGLSAWVADYRGAMGLAVGDWDGDGDQDLFVTHWIAQENALYVNMQADFAMAGTQAEAPMRFSDMADQFGLGQIALDYIGWGTAFLDYDNDGRQDLFVINGSTFQQADNPTRLVPMPMQLFWNQGPEVGFSNVGPVSGAPFNDRYVGRGLAVGDYDNDGDVDAFVVVNGGPAMLLRNEGGNMGGWLKVRLVGSSDNRFGIGAKVRAVVGGQNLVEEVGSESSYYSQHAVGEVVFGLGRASRVDTLEIVWPGGAVQRIPNLPVNQAWVVTQGGGITSVHGKRP